MNLKLLCLLMGFLILCGCSEPIQTATPIPTPVITPSDTIVPTPTIPPGTQLPFNLSTPAIVIENPAPEDTPSATPTQIPLSSERVSILRPADGSMITSPVRVVGQAGPAALNRIEIRLIGEDGRLITQYFS